jgi:hypothetical protein
MPPRSLVKDPVFKHPFLRSKGYGKKNFGIVKYTIRARINLIVEHATNGQY